MITNYSVTARDQYGHEMVVWVTSIINAHADAKRTLSAMGYADYEPYEIVPVY